MTNLRMNEIMDEAELPVYYTAYTPASEKKQVQPDVIPEDSSDSISSTRSNWVKFVKAGDVL